MSYWPSMIDVQLVHYKARVRLMSYRPSTVDAQLVHYNDRLKRANEPCPPKCSSGYDLCPTQGTPLPTLLNELNCMIRQRKNNTIRFANNEHFIMELGYKKTKNRGYKHGQRNKAQRARA